MDYIQIAFDFVIIIIGLIIVFGKSYSSEKGKNLATKEDIGLITKEMESVKNDILFSVQRKNEFLKERKEIALSFQDNATYFIDYASKVVDGLVNNDNNPDFIYKQIENVNLQESKVLSSFLKIYVYYDKSSFRDSAKYYYDSTVKLQQLALSLLYQIVQIDQKKSIRLNSFLNGQMELKDELTAMIKSRKEQIENHIIERDSLLENEVYKTRQAYIYELSEIVKIKE